jgi:hypothetical protein
LEEFDFGQGFFSKGKFQEKEKENEEKSKIKRKKFSKPTWNSLGKRKLKIQK